MFVYLAPWEPQMTSFQQSYSELPPRLPLPYFIKTQKSCNTNIDCAHDYHCLVFTHQTMRKERGGVGWGGRWISFYSSSVTLQMHALHEIFSKTWQLCFLNISWNRPHTYFKWTHGCRKDSREHCMMSMRQRDRSTLLVTISNIFWYWQPRMVEMYYAKSVLGKASIKMVNFRT